MTKKEMFMHWLNDAYAMERGATDILGKYADDLEDYPEAEAKFLEFKTEAEKRVEELEAVIEKLDGNKPDVKTAMAKIASMAQSGMSELMHDQPIKHMIVTGSSIGMAMASYISLESAAKEVGETEVAALAASYHKKAMEASKWLHEYTPKITTEFLNEEHED